MDIQEISPTIPQFLKAGGGAVLMDGVEYLTSRFSFNTVYKLLQELRFDFLEANAVLLIPVNLEAFAPQERALLSRELKTLK